MSALPDPSDGVVAASEMRGAPLPLGAVTDQDTSLAPRLRIWRELRPVFALFAAAQPGRLLLGAALAAVTVLMGMALLGVAGWFITATALAGVQAATAISFDVFAPSAGIRLLALGRTASRYGERLVTHDATFAVLATLRERLFRGWARPEAARQLLVQPARLLFRLTADIDALESFYLRLWVPAGAALGAALLAGVVWGTFNVWLGLVGWLWLLGAGWGIALVVGQRARRPAVARAMATEALRERTVDLVAGQTDLAMAGQLDVQCTALAVADRHLARADLLLNRLEVRAGMAYDVVGTLTLVGVLLAVGGLVGTGVIGAPGAALALLLALTATEPFAALQRGALEAGRSWLAARRLGPRLAASADAGECGARYMAADAENALQLTNVSYAHPGSLLSTVHNVTLSVAAGERVALVGVSGAGKSTLLALVAGELTPRTGAVQVQRHSLLTQRTELFQDSLRDNLRLGDSTAGDARLWAVLQAAGLAQQVRSMAAGLDTPLGGGMGLSGGQSRRLALARLLLRPVPLWLLDEPTEALDSATAHDVLARLASEAGGHTLLIATHLRREAVLAERVVCMEQGRVVADFRRDEPGFDVALDLLRPD